jgi:bifunctional non-homologous end joining protein LigD
MGGVMNGEQLPLEFPGGTRGRLPDHIEPMQPSVAAAPFDDPDYLFEPWWPGVRAFAFVEGGAMRLQAEGLTDALNAVPELVTELPGQLAEDGVVLDGTLVVLDASGALDPELLRARLAGSRRSGDAGRPAYIASDLVWSAGATWTRRPFGERRDRLAAVLRDGDRSVVGRAFRREGTLLAEALGPLGIGALPAKRLDARYRPGRAGEAWLRIPIAPAPPSDARPQLALIQRLPLEVP